MTFFSKIILVFWFFLFALDFSFAQWIPDAFVVEVEPSSFGVNENVDLTIKAVMANWETVKDYDGDVFIEVDGIIDPDNYVVPSDGLYTFVPQDQWVKLFSKGLNIKVPGTYSILVSDIIDETISGKMTVIIWDNSSTDVKDITMISPIPGSVQTSDPIEIMWQVLELPNSNFQVYANGIKVWWWVTSADGSFSTYITDSLQWENKLQVKIIDINGEVIGESVEINYTFQSVTDGIFQKIDILPWINTKQWDKLTFNVHTSDETTTVELNLSDWQKLPMDRITAGNFTKQLLMEKAGEFSVSLVITVAWNKKIYTDVASYIVQENIGIWTVKFFTTNPDKTSVNIIWDMIWEASQYKINYGISVNNLDKTQNVSSNEIILENLNPEQEYFIKITPLWTDWSMIGTPSDVQSISPGHLGASEDGLSCIVNWITVYTERIGNKYYLNWNFVENAEKYIVYRSDFENTAIDKMQKVGESTDTRFEYPFNNLSQVDQYAYYAVQAICNDGSEVLLDNVKRVHVGPGDNLLLFFVVVSLMYVGYRLYRNVV